MSSTFRIFFILLPLLLASGSLLAAWEITRFVAYEGPPVDAPDRRKAWEAANDPSAGVSLADQATGLVSPGWRAQEEGREQPDPDFKDIIPEMENFLSQVAAEYSSMGFVDPVTKGKLDSVVRDANGQPAIRFYIYRSKNPLSPQAWYDDILECDGFRSRRVFIINTAKFAPVNELGRRVMRGVDWATLAHELMHPIIRSSPFINDNCRVGGWISEGIPDAISMDLTRKIRGARFFEALEPHKGGSILKIYGIRNYGNPLQEHVRGVGATAEEKHNHNYPTSSFWRYLAEAKYSKSREPHKPYPGSRPNAGLDHSFVDYSYVVDLFNTKHPYSLNPIKANPIGDIRWVNEFLKSEPHIKSSLSRMYSRFIASFAQYHLDRIGPARQSASPRNVTWAAPSQEKWMKVLFDGCVQAGSDIGSEEGAYAAVRVHPNAATCIQASPPTGPVAPDTSVRIQTIADLEVLQQLRIGLPDGTIVNAPEIYSLFGEQDPYIAIWTLPLFGVNQDTYILSNMAKQPHLSKRFNGELYFSLGTWESDLTTVPMPPPAPVESSDGWRPTKREQLKKKSEQARADPLNHLLPFPSVKRSGYNKPARCNPQRLSLNMCGPQLKIKLMLAPFGAVASVRGTGAMELFQDAAGFSGANPMLVMQQQFTAMVEVERQMQARDGNSIRIAIPKIDYGFSGSFDNAVILVDKAKDPKRDNSQHYRAIGPPVPRADGPGEISAPPSGKVTIDEYSHLMLRGSFSAGLVDDGPHTAAEPVIVKTISGSFSIPSPFEGDEDFQMVAEHFEQEMIQNSLEMMPTGHAPMQDILQQVGTPPELICQKMDKFQLRAMGMEEACRGAASGGNLTQCSCDCDERPVEELQQVCKTQCRNAWKKCPVPDDQLGEDLAAEVTHYRSLLDEKGMPPEVQEGLLEAFKKMPKWQRKLTVQGFK